jgi:hypothetical protein
MADQTVAEKLLIKPGSSLWNSHPARRELLGTLPAGVSDASDPAAASTAIVVADDASSVRDRFAADGAALRGSGNLRVRGRRSGSGS